jgi:hypothetical protein
MLLLHRIAVSIPLLLTLTVGQARAEPVVIDEQAAKRLVLAAEKAIESMEREIAKMPANVAPKGLKASAAKARAHVVDLKALIQRASPPVACPPVAPPETPTNTVPALEADRFTALVAAMKAKSFQTEREPLLRAALVDRGLTVAQTVEVLGIASFTADRLKFLEIIAPRPVDLNDVNKRDILALFSMAADRTKAEALLAR